MKELSNCQQACLLTAILTIVLSYLYRDSFNPTLAAWNNDHPLGLMIDWQHNPEHFTKGWNDNNWLGFNQDGRPVTFTWVLLFLAKYPASSLLIVLLVLGMTMYGIYIGIKQLWNRN